MCVCVCVCVCARARTRALSCVQLCNPMDCSRQAPLSMEFSRQEYWSGLPFPTHGDLSNPGIKPECFASPALAGRFFTTSAAGSLFVFFYEQEEKATITIIESKFVLLTA